MLPVLPVLPVAVAYVLSFIYIGIYWSNDHHMLHTSRRVIGTLLWANLHLMFWLSLIPATTAWMGQACRASCDAKVFESRHKTEDIAFSLEGLNGTRTA